MSSSVAVIAAHPDDEVLGCGGTIALMSRNGFDVHILLIADGETARFSALQGSEDGALVRNRHESAHAACRRLGCRSVELLELPDNRLDGLELLQVVKCVGAFIDRYCPTTVFTHHAGDVNVDHRVVHDAVMAACRPVPGHPVTELLFFEVPSSTEWRPSGSGLSFQPNWFVDISSVLTDKMAALRLYQQEMRAFPHPRSMEAVQALAHWRGATAGFHAAEAFVLGRKLIGSDVPKQAT